MQTRAGAADSSVHLVDISCCCSIRPACVDVLAELQVDIQRSCEALVSI